MEKSTTLVYEEDGRPQTLGVLTLVHDGVGKGVRGNRSRLGALAANALVVLLSALGSVTIYQLLVTRRLLGLSRQLRGFTADDTEATALGCATAGGHVVRDELDELSAAISDLKSTGARALREIDERLSQIRSLMDSLPDLVWLKDTEGVYLACNPRFAEFFGRPESEFLGRTDHDFYDRELADSFRENDRLATPGGPRTDEEWLTSVAGYRGLFETVK